MINIFWRECVSTIVVDSHLDLISDYYLSWWICGKQPSRSTDHMQTYPAEIPQIVRAYRKDEEQIDQLIRIASDLCKDLLGHRLWIRYYRDIAIVTRLVYYSATTLSGNIAYSQMCHAHFRITNTRRRISCTHTN
jgi:hypothetical protein